MALAISPALKPRWPAAGGDDEAVNAITASGQRIVRAFRQITEGLDETGERAA
jgi:hypothetical protein